MTQADLRFYAELNDFLPPSRRLVSFTHIVEASPSIKDMIESQGVPHTEVDRIVVNGESVDFSVHGGSNGRQESIGTTIMMFPK
jgi:hypothetical protein